ncbi:hypothetical protein [Microcoleus sp. F10-B2]
MNLAASNDLIYGSLNLHYPTGEEIEYLATSGCTGWQQPGDEWAIARGPLPRGNYEIPTTPYWLDTRGVEGWFFHITPDPVVGAGGSRSELGVHFDANVPGSAGCLVLRNRSGWERFCDRLAKISKSGIGHIPLTVAYN